MENVWDQLADMHHQQNGDKSDVTFHHVFLPLILAIIEKEKDFSSYSILDAGCGSGYLTELISKYSSSSIGIDTSTKSIDAARKHNHHNKETTFECISIEKFCDTRQDAFDFIISHLVLHLIPEIESTLQYLSKSLKNNGKILFSIPHPCFWALTTGIGTWNFIQRDGYEYHKASLEKNLIQIGVQSFVIDYYHRPLEMYTSLLDQAGLLIERNWEPIPDDILMLQHGKKPWPYPRFIFFECVKK